VTKVNAETILQALADAIADFFLRADAPMDVVPHTSGTEGINASGRGPLCEFGIRRHGRDRDREQTQIPRGYIYEDRSTGDQTAERYDPGDPLPPISDRVRVGEIYQYVYEMAVDVRVTIPLAAVGRKDDGSPHTYERIVDIPADSPLVIYDELTVEDEVTVVSSSDGSTGETVQVRGEYEWRSTREIERILADAIGHHDPTDGNEPLPDPRPASDPDRAASGTLPNLLDIRLLDGEDRDEPSSDGTTVGKRIWEQRIELEYYRLVNTVERDGPTEVITEVVTPTHNNWMGDTDDVWPGTIVNVTDNILPSDVEDD